MAAGSSWVKPKSQSIYCAAASAAFTSHCYIVPTKFIPPESSPSYFFMSGFFLGFRLFCINYANKCIFEHLFHIFDKFSNLFFRETYLSKFYKKINRYAIFAPKNPFFIHSLSLQ
jgi:hypothetical protein